MATGQDVLDAIEAQKTIVGGLKIFVDDLRQKLADALAANNGVLTQAQVDQVFADATANNQAIAEAMAENVP
jgi:hypothetical protein